MARCDRDDWPGSWRPYRAGGDRRARPLRPLVHGHAHTDSPSHWWETATGLVVPPAVARVSPLPRRAAGPLAQAGPQGGDRSRHSRTKAAELSTDQPSLEFSTGCLTVLTCESTGNWSGARDLNPGPHGPEPTQRRVPPYPQSSSKVLLCSIGELIVSFSCPPVPSSFRESVTRP